MVASESFEPTKTAAKPADQSALGQQWQDINQHRGIVQAREGARMPAPVEKPGAPVNEPKAAAPSGDALVSTDTAGIIHLRPYIGQKPLRDYPGSQGTAQDVQNTQDAIDKVPGAAGESLGFAFEIFKQNYTTRVGENKTPESLALTDVPKNLSDKVAHWQLHYDVDLYNKETHGPLGIRDLRPNTDIAPGGGKLPQDFFATGFDSQGKPVEVLKYDQVGGKSRYLGQYQFKYEDLPEGMHRVTVRNWVDAEMNKTKLSGPQQVIGDKLNTLAGISQYYYDSAGHCVEAVSYKGSTLLQPDKSQWKPFDDMKFPTGLASRSMEERTRASRMDFFNTFGPRLPEVQNGQ